MPMLMLMGVVMLMLMLMLVMVMAIGTVMMVAMLGTVMRLILHIKTKNGIKRHLPPMYSNDRCRRRQMRLNRAAGRRNLRRIKLIRL